MSEPRPVGSTPGSDPHSAAFAQKFGAFLSAEGLADDIAVRRAQRAQAQSGERFDFVLTRLGLLSEGELARHLARFLSLPMADKAALAAALPYPNVIQPSFLRANRVLPLEATGERVVIAMADPFDEETASAVAFAFEAPVERRVAPAGDIERAIEALYDAPAGSGLDRGSGEESEAASDDDVRRLADLASEAPVIRMVQDLIARAAESGASDIHIEPREDSVRVRYRIDGVLHTTQTLPPGAKAAVTSRIKIMARLNIAERRLPQDGRVKANVRGREIDLRVSTMPTLHGESVVLRLLDRASVALTFPALGFSGAPLAGLQDLLDQPNGIVLVTGPTGSGKTTTLYAALERLNTPERKIFTVEDPIEYQITGINQIQVQPKIGLTFAHALRSILRQDPDVIMVGEIRDLETAEIAIQASLTGHLVLSTVHTNSAAATITRLLDMGVEDYLLASSITGILGQRLVRRLCEGCAAPAELPPGLIDKLARGRDLGGLVRRPRRKVGCATCRHTGYLGRTTICELMTIDDTIRDRILARAGERAWEDAARAGGLVTMQQDGLAKALAGETTIDEVLRATRTG